MRLGEDEAAQLAEMFHLMGDPSRLRILLSCVEQRRAVGDIAASVGLSPSLVSHHLRLLRAARILRAEREGRHVYYSGADEHIGRVLRDMVAHVSEPAEAPEG